MPGESVTMEEFVTFEEVYADLLQTDAAKDPKPRRRRPPEPDPEEPPLEQAAQPATQDKIASEPSEAQPVEKAPFFPRSEGRSARARRRSQRLNEQSAQEAQSPAEPSKTAATAEPESAKPESFAATPAQNSDTREIPAPSGSRRLRRAGRHQEPEITDENAASLLRSRRRNRNPTN